MNDNGNCTLKVNGLSKSFGGVVVFKDINLLLKSKDVIGVIGPNGAGKTTLINVISGQLDSSDGDVLLGGNSIKGLSFPNRSRLGVVRSFRQTSVFGGISVRDNILRAARFCHKSNEIGVESAFELSDKFGLSKVLDTKAQNLPYGMQKLAGLLMTLATTPKIMLLDEPAAGLESKERYLVDEFVQHSVSELGCGILLVEHDMELVKRLCASSIVLHNGKLLAEGDPNEVLSRQDVVEAYIGVVEE